MARKIINISLPAKMAAQVKKEIAKGKFASTSEFFRDLLRKREEAALLAELKESQKEIHQGKGKILRSLADLR